MNDLIVSSYIVTQLSYAYEFGELKVLHKQSFFVGVHNESQAECRVHIFSERFSFRIIIPFCTDWAIYTQGW